MYRLLTRGTVEERILQRAEKKLYLDQACQHIVLLYPSCALTNGYCTHDPSTAAVAISLFLSPTRLQHGFRGYEPQ